MLQEVLLLVHSYQYNEVWLARQALFEPLGRALTVGWNFFPAIRENKSHSKYDFPYLQFEVFSSNKSNFLSILKYQKHMF